MSFDGNFMFGNQTRMTGLFDGLFDAKQSYKPQFRDFDIIELIGEGSFGRVFKVKHRDSGLIMAMKVMKKQFLVQNN